uniref:Uncharacterized protein n=1 Tax=Molossus molossus TaxID=27622 RepID=A0A7J8GQN9_MOLMO|nr:hypothetical protein HJG59_011276 [Molossus molossus]
MPGLCKVPRTQHRHTKNHQGDRQADGDTKDAVVRAVIELMGYFKTQEYWASCSSHPFLLIPIQGSNHSTTCHHLCYDLHREVKGARVSFTQSWIHLRALGRSQGRSGCTTRRGNATIWSCAVCGPRPQNGMIVTPTSVRIKDGRILGLELLLGVQ